MTFQGVDELRNIAETIEAMGGRLQGQTTAISDR